MGPVIHANHLPYQLDLDQRDPDRISLLVIHCTELPDLRTAREYGERILYETSATGNSGHYYIDVDGRIEQYVDTDRVAHHVRGYNEQSIGIELVNTGRYPNWHHSEHQTLKEPYPTAQIEALVGLIHHLTRTHPGLSDIAGHEDLDTDMIPSTDNPDMQIRRKMDPGPLFPWGQVLSETSLTRIGLP